MSWRSQIVLFFFFNDTATTEIYTLSLHDALPICGQSRGGRRERRSRTFQRPELCLGQYRSRPGASAAGRDRKSTPLNSSHLVISYAVFCLKKKKNADHTTCLAPSQVRPHRGRTPA